MSVCGDDLRLPIGTSVSLQKPYEPHQCIGATDLFAARYPYEVYFRGVFWGASSPACPTMPVARAHRIGEWELCSGDVSGHCLFGEGTCDFGAHAYVCASDYSRHRGHFFGLWREPRTLAASNFIRAIEEGFLPEASQAILDTLRSMGVQQYNASDSALRRALLLFANASRAHVTRLLAGATPADTATEASRFPAALIDAYKGGVLPTDAPASAAPVLPVAIDRLNHGFAFVGLTDEFALSACTFHLDFGDECTRYELDNGRATGTNGPHATALLSTSALADMLADAGWEDPVDGALYKVAHARFVASVTRLGATPEVCAKIGCALDADFCVDRYERDPQLWNATCSQVTSPPSHHHSVHHTRRIRTAHALAPESPPSRVAPKTVASKSHIHAAHSLTVNHSMGSGDTKDH